MAIAEPTAAPPAATAPEPGVLQKGALGLPQVLFLIVTGAAPLAAMIFNVPITVLGGGFSSPAAFLIATVVLTIFSVGYIEMAQRVTATGGFYTFITRGFGRVAGLGTAWLIAFCYVVFSAAVLGSFGYFASTSINTWTGADIPAYVYSAAGLVLFTAFAWFHIELTARVLGVFLCCEVVALLVFSIATLVQGGADGLSAQPVNPLEVFGNDSALKTFGAAATGVALFGAFWSWVGFEMAPNYAEESRNPRRIAKIATYVSVIGLGVFYIFCSYAFVTGWGVNGVSQGVADQFAGKSASAFYPLTDRFVGSGMTTIFEILVITSSFACAMAFYNTAARYLFSLARERLLPGALGRTHRTHASPYVASMVVTGLMFVYMLGFTIYDPSTTGFLLKLGTWSPLLGVLGILAIQALCSFAVIRYFLTTARDGFHPWKTLIAPIIGGLAQMGACYFLIKYRGDLSGAGDVLYIKVLPYVPVVVFLAGMAAALWMKANDRVRYAGIGSFEHDDVAVHDHHPMAGGVPNPAGA
jgi:amino acid transporter